MKPLIYAGIVSLGALVAFTADKKPKVQKIDPATAKVVYKLYVDESRFADLQVIKYNVPGFDKLSPKQKELVYYLSEAALSGRDIVYDQNYKYNLRIRKTLETLYENYSEARGTDDFKRFEVYLKRVWFSNGIHHHYSETKIIPEFSINYFRELVAKTPAADFPLMQGQTKEQFVEWIIPILFDPSIDGKRVNKDAGVDHIVKSASNFYEGVTEKEVMDFYNSKKNASETEPISYGLNSKLVKKDGQLFEKVWKSGGMYGQAIDKITFWLENAIIVAETPEQAEYLTLLVKFYKTGDLKVWDECNIKWVKDLNSSVDFINGFIEVYHDPIGLRADYESAVEIKDFDASDRMKTIAGNAQWFEDNSPIMPEFKKKNVKGVTYKVVNVAMEAGDAAPSTPIGINLPNAEWIREKHGSKSVSLGNIVEAYATVSSDGILNEFCYTGEEAKRAKEYGALAGKLHTAMHEVIGHASGQMMPGKTKDDMGNYGSTLEEARADLVALYYIMDQKLVDMGVMPSLEVGKTEYEGYIRGGLMLQLRRLQPGENIEEDHMRNRQLVASWVYEKGKSAKVIEKVMKDGKTFFVIKDYAKLRVLFGELLKEIQRIKSTGDYEGGKKLVETYGVKVDQKIHKEVLSRVSKLDIAPYGGFIQPKYTITDDKNVTMDEPESFTEQMLRYGKTYNFLPYEN
ncbi:MAG: dihydrofolate reductase [Bacteroidia bacterium]|nr:dihydrofolate reductase [Bacteroidia bacterium]